MRPTNPALGVTLLLVAAAVAVYTTDGSGESGLSDKRRGESLQPRGTAQADRPHPKRAAVKSSVPRGSTLPVLETLHVEPYSLRHPAIEAQASRVETGALNRLEEMIADLDLTERQQLDIFPILARSHPDYSGNLRMIGVPNGPLSPIGKLAAHNEIYKILDPDQKLELELSAIEAEAWWTDVISRLERDLRESTTAPVATGSAPPEHDPSPPKDDPPPPSAVTPAAPHRGNNLFDLLQDDQS